MCVKSGVHTVTRTVLFARTTFWHLSFQCYTQ